MTVAVLTPTVTGQTVDLGRSMFRKQILKPGQLKYGDRTLNFTRDYFDKIAAAFRDRAFDAVPLQLSDEHGAHNNSPLLTRGDVVGLESDDTGLYATVSLTDEGAALVREHPNLGVSVRVVEDFERGDGRTWPAALQHVLACWQPRVTGMSAWQAVEASNPGMAVLDLSALSLAEPATPQDPPASAGSGDGSTHHSNSEEAGPVPQATKEEVAQVLALAPLLQKIAAQLGVNADSGDVTETEAVVTPIVAAQATDAGASTEADEDVEVEQAIAAAVGDGEGNTVDLAVVELRTVVDRQAIQLAEMQGREDDARWQYESEQLVRDFGIPPAIVALAEPLLRGRKHIVELSGGRSVDAGDVLRTVLTTVAKTYGKRVDLSGPLGSAHEADGTEDEAAAARKRIHDDARARGFGK